MSEYKDKRYGEREERREREHLSYLGLIKRLMVPVGDWRETLQREIVKLNANV